MPSALVCRVTADTVLSRDLLDLQQGQWAFGQQGFLPTVQALNFASLQAERRQQLKSGSASLSKVGDMKNRQFLNVQRFSAGYLSMQTSRVFQEEIPSLQPNFNLKLPLSHRLDMVGAGLA